MNLNLLTVHPQMTMYELLLDSIRLDKSETVLKELVAYYKDNTAVKPFPFKRGMYIYDYLKYRVTKQKDCCLAEETVYLKNAIDRLTK